MLLKDAEGIANSVDPDQTAPLEAVWFGSALFAQAYLSENLGSLRYFFFYIEKFQIIPYKLDMSSIFLEILRKKWVSPINLDRVGLLWTNSFFFRP